MLDDNKIPPIFLLYGGTSEDGRGIGEYRGRTVSVEKAKAFYMREIHNNSYSTGKVVALVKDEMRAIYNPKDFDKYQAAKGGEDNVG